VLGIFEVMSTLLYLLIYCVLYYIFHKLEQQKVLKNSNV